MSDNPDEIPATEPRHFIEQEIAADLESGRYAGRVATRFPPEPNGYLHIGHAKAICLDFGMAAAYGGTCNLRFDDTNPEAEEEEFVHAIQDDVRWLGFDWGDRVFYASDYYERLYECACELIRRGKAYVCTLDTEAFREYRGVPTRPGKESPWRNRPATESLDLFAQMRAGEFEDGALVLRAKIDMASPNLHMRDPVIYRIKHAHHHRTGDTWCIYPMYDFTHCLSDSYERITHSLCTLEFEVHRPLYDWVLESLELYRPRQIEFAPLNLSYTLMSKRLLRRLIENGTVSGWSDPRLPTLRAMRRRGITPEAIRQFCKAIGVTKYAGLTEIGLFEHTLRDDLNRRADRRLGVLDPLKVVIENYPEDTEEYFSAVNNPENEARGTRELPFSREIYIDRADFMEDPPRKFHRLSPGSEVRLRYACYITCRDVVKDPQSGEVTELRCTFDPESRGGSTPDGRRVKGTIHWVSVRHARKARVLLYDRLLKTEDSSRVTEDNIMEHLNPESLVAVDAFVEPSVEACEDGIAFQLERVGYFCVDREATAANGLLTLNRTVGLRDTWAKTAGR